MTSWRLSAEWTHHPGCSCSKMSLGCSLRTVGQLWAESWRDWPAQGMWDATGFWQPPMSEPATGGNECSSLLPTPTNDDGKTPDQHMAMKAGMGGGPRYRITSLSVLARAGFRQPER